MNPGFDRAESNVDHIAEHDVTPEEAEEVFEDPRRVAVEAYNVPLETRRAILGMTETGRLLHVVYTMRHGLIRVVSAREVTRRNQRRYRARG